jgi:GTP-binding protein
MPAPVVAIVGRPNVGKSTLFNRLTGRRAALVSDMPGLTRDRREGKTEIGNDEITLVDTAGLEEGDDASIAGRMRKQTEAAITAADLVLFVIDARTGVVPADAEFARVARQSGRPVILVANKCEGRAGLAGLYEAFELGLGEPVAVSAEHGEGLGELLADIAAALGLADEGEASPEEGGENVLPDATAHEIRVAIVGRPNAGKSTLVNALVGEERMITGPEPGLTRDSIATPLTWRGRKLSLVDTAGLRRKARIEELAEKLAASDAVRTIRFAEVVVLLLDAERPLEKQDLTIGDMVTEEGRAIVIAVNKWDLVTDKQRRLKEIRDETAERLAQIPGVKVIAISALGEKGLDKLLEAVVDAYEIWNKRVSTAGLNRWLEEAMSRHAPPASHGRRIKIRFMTQPTTRPPTFVAFCSQPQDLPKSYLRYLTNSLRESFGLPGVPIRLNLRKGENPFADKRRRK